VGHLLLAYFEVWSSTMLLQIKVWLPTVDSSGTQTEFKIILLV